MIILLKKDFRCFQRISPDSRSVHFVKTVRAWGVVTLKGSKIMLHNDIENRFVPFETEKKEELFLMNSELYDDTREVLDISPGYKPSMDEPLSNVIVFPGR